jgi:glycosyltransferase involved in cell wall biosynthesis
MSSPKLSIIIPAFNEAAIIDKTIKSLIARPRLYDAEIIIVDDGSTDQTAEIAQRCEKVKVISHRVNRGYGSSLVTGIRNSKGEYVVWYDADGQHRPDDLLRVFDELYKSNLDYCIGVRSIQSHRVKSRQLGKFILRKVVDIAAGEKVNDFNSGLRGFRRKVISQYLHLFPKGFSASTTTTLIMKERGYIGGYVEIKTRKRIGKSSVNQLKDGAKTLMIILRIVLLFKPLLFWGSIGLILIFTGFVYGIFETITVGLGFPVFGALLIILGVQSFFFGLISDQISLQRRERFEKYE